ncbi:NAD(P)H-dependent oxidoreductase [Streptomyces sp. NBC_01808]|uniref:NADPH-dependent FMN reductase n=1 Tax=Streptomyces sp. NBC_01808 TaxID=2975947 RepID=UPI002DDA8CD4|nr:NAD(P)H-dependent oxidoreductase [Streptomyces sp. NBC_01808]WSA39133.1 NAD(P)H-dependent oxidoreductase [Streptomyces sp. NBC_01808]
MRNGESGVRGTPGPAAASGPSGAAGAGAPLRIACILGGQEEPDCRPPAAAHWLDELAGARGGMTLRVLDLADYDLPLRYPAHPTEQMASFTAELAWAEGFVVVTPECNRSFPAQLKHAIDIGYDEWHAKPVGFVSYGFGCDGVRAVEHLRSVFTELHTVTVRDSVGIDLRFTDEKFPAGGSLYSDGLVRAAGALLDQLTWWGLALREARATRPYVA